MVVLAVFGFFAKELRSGTKDRVSKAALGPVWDYVETVLPSKINEFEKQTKESLSELIEQSDKIYEAIGQQSSIQIAANLTGH